MSFAHIGKIEEVSDITAANLFLESGYELLQIVPGKTSDGDPCTLFYLGKPKPKAAEPRGHYVDGDWVES
jgi:hypothetical protein